MGNELPKSTQERITNQAKAYSGFDPDSDHTPYTRGLFQGYRTGAIAENGRAQSIIVFLEEVSDSSCDYESVNFSPPFHSKECRACKAKELLQQWKGEKEEIKDPCPNCGKELHKDRHGCCRQCGAYEFNTNPQK